MKAFLLLIVLFVVTLQVSAQERRLGYHRYDGTYVEPQYRTFSDGYVYDSWCCNENAVIKQRSITKRYYDTNRSPRRASIKSYTYPSRKYNSYNNYYSNRYSNSNRYNTSGRYYYDSNYSRYYVNTQSLNVRSGPSSTYELLGTLSYAESVTVLDTYTNGWTKIQYSFFDPYSSSFNTRYGYVAGNYLSTSKPNANYSYTTRYNDNYYNYNTYNSNVYSSISKASPRYEVGGITIWTNCGTDGEIKVYIDDVYVGMLTEYFTNGAPKCDEEGTLFIEKAAGTYNLVAKGEKNTWSGVVTITRNKCLIQGLER